MALDWLVLACLGSVLALLWLVLALCWLCVGLYWLCIGSVLALYWLYLVGDVMTEPATT
jgi:hypothetical protein